MPTVCDAEGPALGFTRRGRYAWRNKVAGLMVNLSGDSEEAVRQMQLTAGQLNPAVRKPDYHIVLTWHAGEKVSCKEMLDAGVRFMEKIGAAEHQALLAVHDNTRQRHLHIVLNRVHPWTGKALPLWRDYERGELACREIELEMGFTPDRGRFDAAIEDGKVMLQPKPAAHWKRKTAARAAGLRSSSRATRGSARDRGLPLLRDGFAETPLKNEGAVQALRKKIVQADTWADVQVACRTAGLIYEVHRSGGRLRSLSHGHHMAASEIGTEASLPGLQARLGPLPQADSPVLVRKRKSSYKRRPEIAALHSAFERQIQRLGAIFGGRRAPAADYLRRALKLDLKKALKACREMVRRMPSPGRQEGPQGIRGALARRFLTRSFMTGSDPVPDHTDLRQMMERSGVELQAGLPQVRDLKGSLWTVLEVGAERRLAGFLNEAASPPLLAKGTHPSTGAFLARVQAMQQTAEAEAPSVAPTEPSPSRVAVRAPEAGDQEPGPL